jgi:alpha-tubulin suppressor-like RCC1 family protein
MIKIYIRLMLSAVLLASILMITSNCRKEDVPEEEMTLPVIAISSGASHSLALTTDGTLWAWGHNENGQVGDGSWLNRHKPVKIGSGFKKISSYAHFS